MKAKKHTQWIRLDNAAKIFPPTSDKRDPKVFRFACEINEKVKEAPLQQALEKTLESFPSFLTVLKHGFFWYYLETTDIKPVVKEEKNPICTPLFDRNEASLLFDISYYKNRINLEVFHAITDGTGAVEFLKALVCNYLKLVHDELKDAPVVGDGSSVTEKMQDSFQKYYNPKNKKTDKMKFSYKVKATRLSENRIKVIEGIMPVDKLLEVARSYDTTITVFLTALLFCAINDGMSIKDRKHPVTISVPVNLRNYFESESVRNFFGIIYISHKFDSENESIESVIKDVAKQLKEGLTQEKIEQHMNSLVSMEKNMVIRAIPLAIKDLGLKIAYNYTDMSVTAALSNIGKIKMPEEYSPYIRLFDVMTSTKKIQICMCSYNNNMVVNFADSFVSADIEKYFFRELAKMGVDIEIVSNPLDGGRVAK